MPRLGVSVSDLCRKHGISGATFYKWRMNYAGLEVSDVKKLRQLEDENRRLKQMVAEQALTAKKTGSAQGEANGGAMDGRAFWAESATGVSVSRAGSEHAAIPKLAIRGSG